MEIKVLEHGTGKVENVRCPECGHTNTVNVKEKEGIVVCWFCLAKLEWKRDKRPTRGMGARQ